MSDSANNIMKKIREQGLRALKRTSAILGLLLLIPITPVIMVVLGLLSYGDIGK